MTQSETDLKALMQKAYSIARVHLLTQKRKSARRNPTGWSCLYRGPAGLKCAVGCLIPDELYDEDFEHTSAVRRPVLDVVLRGLGVKIFDSELQDYILANRSGDLGRFVYFLDALQAVHDRHAPEEWETCLNRLAIQFGITQ